MVELRLAGHHLSLLGVVGLLASDSTEHVELLADATRHWTKPDQDNNREFKLGLSNMDKIFYPDICYFIFYILICNRIKHIQNMNI